MGIQVGVLGPVELRRDGVPVPLAGAPQRVVLARLALAGGRAVPPGDLIDALWGEEPPENAIGNLHSYVSRLRRHTGMDAIKREPGGYRLVVPAGAVDAERVETLVRRSHREPSGTAADTLTEALAVWRGDPLADVAGRMAFAPDVARLAEWRRHLREQCFEHRLDAGQAAEALPGIEALTTAEPLRERAWLLLMRALHASGRTPEALTAARAFRTRLAEGHGVDPSPALAALQHRILADDPALRPTRRDQAAADLEPVRAGGTTRDENAAPRLAWQAAGAAAKEPRAIWQEARTAWREAHPNGWDLPARTTPPTTARITGQRSDRFFGRERELAAIRQARAADRVVTLVGPGGVGKTRLMIEALTGDELVVELAERSVPADVAAAVAGALGLRAAPRGGIAALAERLGAAPAMLVLDNCEHLADAVRELVHDLLARCPGLRVLATSRRRIDVAGERVIRVGPLPAADRVALFCDRAALLRGDFRDDSRTRELAGEICHLVDGLPLAVELAARREAVFGLVHLRDRLGAGLDVIDPARGGDRATAVSATVEWSYRLLDPAAQHLLDRLAVCRGGFGLDALAHLAPPRSPGPHERRTQEETSVAEALLAELVDVSLVVGDLSATPPRYRLLATVRHVALGHLGQDAARSARDAHARWMLAHAEELIRRGHDRDPWTTPALRRELANLQEALTWLGESDDGARLAALLAVSGSEAPDPGLTEQLARCAPQRVASDNEMYRALAAGVAAWISNRLPEADRLLTAALERMPAGHPLRGPALLCRVSNSMFAGRAADVRADAERVLADPQASRSVRATGLCCAALMDAYAGNAEAGRAWLDRHEPELRTGGLDGFVPFTRGELLAGDDPEQALAWYDRSIAASDRVNQVYMGNVARVARAAALIRLRRPAAAAPACHEVLGAVRAAGMTAQVWTTLRLTAELLADLGDPATAAMIVRAADTDPLAPAVMGPDVARLERLRSGAEPSPVPGTGDTASIVEHVRTLLARHI